MAFVRIFARSILRIMYLPAHFQSSNAAWARRLLREHPLANLVSNDDAGFPFVSHLPLHLDETDGHWVLRGHCARANPHWRYLKARPQALATFLGPHAYLSPQVYPDLARVPTWNYLAVHCRVEATVVDGPDAKDRLLKTLIADHDPAYAAQWKGLDGDFQRRMLAGMVGFDLRVTDLQCKIKINQHRPEAHAAMRAAYAAGDDNARGLGAWMDRLGLNGAIPDTAGEP
jgi:transcriptional regulator